MLSLIYLVISTILLAKSAEIVVDSAAKLSRYFGISQVTIGLVLVAVTTSLPELVIAVVSSSMGEGAISAGNVFGSNIANIFLVIGLGAFLYSSKIPRKNIGEIGLALLLTTVISAYIIFNSTVQGWALGFPGGAMLLIIFAIYIFYLVKEKKKVEKNHKGSVKEDKKKAMYAFVLFVAGMIVVFISSGFVVDNAVLTAQRFGIAESVIGATIIAVGTSLPELTTTLQALKKKRYGMAIGNVIGSNMTNITLVLGATAVINEIYVNLSVFIAALLFAVVANTMGRYSGLFFILIYAVFIVTMLWL